uniref:DnaT-like ssDNA-binding domain-containing protein n=1 Tax=Marinobacterium profundum TaxID=1714300 RepID=UPI000831ED81|nr:DnaT-like ssDNA-binding domain-containing protein [Marinobacterium profundum]
MNQQTVAALLRRPIAYHPIFRQVTGSTVAAVMLSQMYYWTDGRIGEGRDGWFHKTQQEWELETGLSRSEQDRARKVMKQLGLLKEARRGNPARMWFRLNRDQLFALIGDVASKENPNENISLQDPAIKNAETCNSSKNKELDVPIAPAESVFKSNEINSLQDPANLIAETGNQDCEIEQTALQDSANLIAGSCNLKEQRVQQRILTDSAAPGMPLAAAHPEQTDTPPAVDFDRLFDTTPRTDQRRFAMHWEWQPGPQFAARCQQVGVALGKIPTGQADEILGEFRSYWVDRPAENSQGAWEHKLATRLRMIVPVRPQTAPPVSLTTPQSRRQVVTASVMDIRDTDW